MSINDPIEILLVEDDPDDVRQLQDAFETTDRETTLHVIENGSDAVDFLTQRADREEATLPDLVFLDLTLPGEDGCDVLERIRDDPQLHFLPVLVLTSSDAEEDVVKCYEAYANAYLPKPTDSAGFSSLVESVERFWFERAQLPAVPE